MDPRLIELCFATPTLPPDLEIDDESSVLEHFLESFGLAIADRPDGASRPLSLRASGRTIVTRQLLGDEPFDPAIATAHRLLDAGHPAETVLAQMCCAVLSQALEAMGLNWRSSDPAMNADEEIALALLLSGQTELEDVYAALPLPAVDDLRHQILNGVRATQGLSADELVDSTVTALGGAPSGPSPLLRPITERIMEQLVQTDHLVMVSPDRVVEPATLLADAITVHRITEQDATLGLDAMGDGMATLALRHDVALGVTGVIDAAATPIGTIVRLTVDGRTIRATAVPDDVGGFDVINPSMVELVQAAYEREQAETGLPVDPIELVVSVELADPGRWARPHPPLTDIVTAAGFEFRHGRVGSGAAAWRMERRVAMEWGLLGSIDLDDPDQRALGVVLDALLGADDGDEPPTITRDAVRALRDPDTGPLLIELLVDDDTAEDERDDADAREMLEALVTTARGQEERLMAHWIVGLFEERRGDLAAAAQHFQAAHRASSDWRPVMDGVGWYAFLRGDAAEAARLWRQVGHPDQRELRIAEQFGRPATSTLGRNEPCWCGSGRKFKACHLGVVAEPSLDDRIEWLWTKVVGFMLRRAGGIDIVASLCEVRAGTLTDSRSISTARTDPMVLDAALGLEGWIEDIVRAGAEVLPADELQLVELWASTDRALYEVVAVDSATQVTVREHAEGQELEVRSWVSSVRTGQRWSLHLVPNGRGLHVVGGAVLVPPDTEPETLARLVRGDPFDLCSWLRELDQYGGRP